MRQEQNKDFDAALRKKLQQVPVKPPAELWDRVEHALDHGARKKPGILWAKWAAAICLLAVAATAWYYLGQPKATNPEQPDVANATEREAGADRESSLANTPAAEKQVIIHQPSGSRPDGNDAGQSLSEPVVEPVPQQSGTPGALRESINSSRIARASSRTASPERGLAETSGDARTSAGVPETSGTSPEPERLAALNRTKIQQDIEAAQAPDLKPHLKPVQTPSNATKETEEPFYEEVLAGTDRSEIPAGADQNEDFGFNKNEEQMPIARRLVKESGVEDAVALITDAIDPRKSEFFHIKKDEESGDWKGLQVNLGLITISYNKARNEKKKQ